MTHASDTHHYALALGSNRALAGRLGPVALVKAALALIDVMGANVVAMSPIIASRPIGPSLRTYANAICVVESRLLPPAMLTLLQLIEAKLGRRRARRWGERRIDIDIILWSGGAWSDPHLAIPHIAYRHRDFVLKPLTEIAPDWRDPLTGRTARQTLAQLKKHRPAMVDRSGPAI